MPPEQTGRIHDDGVTVNDLLYVGLTIVTFLVLVLLVKGVERLER